jgi:hypothetical protein
MSLWLAMLAAQASVVTDALAGPPALTDSNLLLTIVATIPHIPGLLVLGGACSVFRTACHIGGFLETDEASSAVLLVGDATFYFGITYYVAIGILKNAQSRGRSLQASLVMGGISFLLANAALTGWMICANKPYYVHSMPGVSIFSLILATLTFLSAFWPVRWKDLLSLIVSLNIPD